MFKNIPEYIIPVLDELESSGYEAYLVGGCVRDRARGKEPNDYDITTNAKPHEMQEVFRNYRVIETGLKHGTLTVVSGGECIEVTTYRIDGEYADNRHPTSVSFTDDVTLDLSRRDFTVNAMAYNHDTGLCDLFGGQEDLTAKILRAVGDPETRFNEDALRILRLFRFASTLNFKIEEKTFNVAIKCAPLISKVSVERIMTELKTAVLGENFKVIKPLIDCGALSFLGLDTCPDFEKISKHRQSPLLCLYLLFQGNIKTDLKLSNIEKDFIKGINRLVKMPPPKSKSDIKRCLAATNETITRQFLTLLDISCEELDEILQNRESYLIGHLKITGNDLLTLGYKGEEVGEILKTLQNEVIENPTQNTKARLLNLITK